MNLFIIVILVMSALLGSSVLTSIAWADGGGNNSTGITVKQDNLTIDEQITLDAIQHAREDGSCPEKLCLPFTANVTIHQNEDTIPIPFEYSGRTCIQNTDGYVPLLTCIWRGNAPDGSQAIYDIEKEQWTSELIVEAEAKQEYFELLAIQEEAKLTPDERRLIVLKEKNNPSKQDLEEISLLEQLGALCRNDTLVSQTYREFDVPTITFRNFDGNMTETLVEDRSINTSSLRENINIKILRMAVQECLGQPYTKKSIQYDHIVVDDGSSLSHKDLAGNVPTWSQARVNAESNMKQTSSGVLSPMCTSINSYSTKLMYNCSMEDLIYETTKPTPVRKDMELTESYQAWLQYLEDKGESQKEKITRDIQEYNYQRLK